MDLDIAPPRTVGRASAPITLDEIRPLAPADIALLQTDRGVKPSPIKRLRDSHHALARVLAAGTKPAEASIITGYSTSHISILQSDPTFQELLGFYRENLDVAYANLHDRMATVSLIATNLIQERLEDEEANADIPLRDLLEVSEKFADRTGHAPKTVNVNVNLDLAGRLEAARRRAGLVGGPPSSSVEAPGQLVIEGTLSREADDV